MMSYEPHNNRTLKVKIGQGVAAAPCLGIVKGLKNAEIIILDVRLPAYNLFLKQLETRLIVQCQW